MSNLELDEDADNWSPDDDVYGKMAENDQFDEGDSEEPQRMFDPPLYLQRYASVIDCIKALDDVQEGLVKSVADLGCAECKFLQQAKELEFLTKLVGVDMDEELLESSGRKLEPGIGHMLSLRPADLSVDVLCGNLSEYDSRLQSIHVITLIEVIEHLHDATIEKMRALLFGRYKPRMVVMTTPNSEYNVLFPNFSGMRHTDHKFEWTRNEFQDWCNSVCRDYPYYKVSYTGVGNPPDDSKHLGHCSQIAVFTSINMSDETDDNVTECQLYKPIFHTKYPGHNQTKEESIRINLIYTINQLGPELASDTDDTSQVYIPVDMILSRAPQAVIGTQTDDRVISHLYDIVQSEGHRLSEDRRSVIVNMDPPSSDESDRSWDDWREELNLSDAEGYSCEREELWD